MTRASLRPYLGLVPLFKRLPRRQQCAVAGRAVTRPLAGGETLDLRGSRANLLCIVSSGKVTVDTMLANDGIYRSELAAGQWAGQGTLIGWEHARSTRLTAEDGEAQLLLLWRQDLKALRFFKILIALSLVARRVRSAVRAVNAKRARVAQRAGLGLLKRPGSVGVFAAIAILVGFLLLTPSGKSLQADWRYLGIVGQFPLAPDTHARLLSSITSLSPGHPLATVELGNLAMRSGNLDTARQRYAALASKSGLAANNLGVLLLRGNEPELARQALLASTELESDAAVAYQNLGIAYQQLGQQQEAVRAFKEALRIDPTLAIARYHLGMYYLSQGALVEAGTAFQRLLEYDVSFAPAHLGLGLVQLEIGNLGEAVEAFRQATRLDPDSVMGHYYLAWTLTRVGEGGAAAAEFRRLLELNPPPRLLEQVERLLRAGASGASQGAHVDGVP
jgi:tetratricopeptide (TPR) repeat protein